MRKTNCILFAILCSCFFLPVASFLIWNFLQTDGALTLFISVSVTSYHFLVRILIGELCRLLSKVKKLSPQVGYFRVAEWEQRFYRKIRFWKWKRVAVTARPETFDPQTNGPEAILQAGLWAEVVHLLCMLASYIPLLLVLRVGAPRAFIITSVLASFIDFYYVLLQRFNRKKLLATIERRKKMRKV